MAPLRRGSEDNMSTVTEKQRKGYGGNVHFLPHREADPDNSAILFELRIENFRHIQRAFGEDVAREVLGGLHRVLAEVLHADDFVVPEPCGTINAIVRNGAALAGRSFRDWLGDFFELMPLIAVDTTVGRVHLWVNASWRIAEGVVNDRRTAVVDTEFAGLPFRGDLPGDSVAWAEQYRSDMALVGKAIPAIAGAISDGAGALEMDMHWQAVRDVNASNSILYHEMLVRLVDRNGSSTSPEAIFLALERLGFVRPIDHHLMSRVIDELEAAPDVALGVNISARSLCSDIWWDEIKARLKRSPNVARRLVVEITETTPIPSISDAVCVVTNLRRLGCMIALDNFGAGYTSVRQQIALSPDIVKIDPLFLRRAVHCQEHRETLRHLVGLARSLRAIVVAEGVETSEQAEVALDVDAVWQQGHHWGAPGAVRLWRMACRESGIGQITRSISLAGLANVSNLTSEGRPL